MRRAAASPVRVVAVAVAVALAAALAGGARAADGDIPAAPTAYVTDRAGFLSAPVVASLEQRLGAYERGTGHQVWVWIDRTTGAVPLEDWTVRAFDKWRVGRKGLDDGVVLFLFSDDRKVRIEVGYGLEGLIPDARAGRIIQSDIVPRIRAGDRDGAVNAGVDALMAAIRGHPRQGRARGGQAQRGEGDPFDSRVHCRAVPGDEAPLAAALHGGRWRAWRRVRRRRVWRWRRWWVRRRRRRQVRRRGGVRVVVTEARPLVHGIDVGVVEEAIRAAEQRHVGRDPRRAGALLVLGRRAAQRRADVRAPARQQDAPAQRRAHLPGAVAAAAGGDRRRRRAGEAARGFLEDGGRGHHVPLSPRRPDGRVGGGGQHGRRRAGGGVSVRSRRRERAARHRVGDTGTTAYSTRRSSMINPRRVLTEVRGRRVAGVNRAIDDLGRRVRGKRNLRHRQRPERHLTLAGDRGGRGRIRRGRHPHGCRSGRPGWRGQSRVRC